MKGMICCLPHLIVGDNQGNSIRIMKSLRISERESKKGRMNKDPHKTQLALGPVIFFFFFFCAYPATTGAEMSTPRG